MKMSDVFTGEVKPKHMDDEAIKELLAGEECGNDWALEDSTYWLATQEEHIKAAAHAINMHDQLVEKLKLVVGNSTVQSTIPDLCEEIETLLTQAKGE